MSIGLQLGGQVYSEVVFFQNAQALENFKLGHLKLNVQASAIALTARAAADLGYRSGVAIVTMAKGGLMYEASVGGQSSPSNRSDPEPSHAIVGIMVACLTGRLAYSMPQAAIPMSILSLLDPASRRRIAECHQTRDRRPALNRSEALSPNQ